MEGKQPSVFCQELNQRIEEFLCKLVPLFKEFGQQPLWKCDQVKNTILQELIARGQSQGIDQSLSNFLKSTINNQLQKRRKKIYFCQDLKQSSSNIFFGSQNSATGKETDQLLFISSDIKNSLTSSKKYKELHDSIPSFVNNIVNDDQSNAFGQLILPPPEPILKNSCLLGMGLNSSHSSVFSQKTYKTYSNEKKKEVVQYAQKYGIKIASYYHQIAPSKIQLWAKQINEEKHTRGRKPIDPDMEENVYLWLKKQLQMGSYITQKVIREKAKSISKSRDFKASKGWLQKFFKRRPEIFQKYSENRKNYDVVGKYGEEQRDSLKVSDQNSDQPSVKQEKGQQIYQELSKQQDIVKTPKQLPKQ